MNSIEVVDRFLRYCGLAGTVESMQESVRVDTPTHEDANRIASEISAAAKADPHVFRGLDVPESELDISRDVAGAFAALRSDGRAASLSQAQQSALEAIVLLKGRPAILVRNDSFSVPTGEWERLAPYRPDISNILKAVGRISVSQNATVPYAGTGFVVGEDLIMTNWHVVQKYIERDATRWRLKPGMLMGIDFKQEFGLAETATFQITDLLGVQEDPDIALLRVATKNPEAMRLPEAVRVQSDGGYVGVGNTVYVVGYPAADPSRNDPTEMHQIYGGVYEKKRISPGRIMSMDITKGEFEHDCTTLGGNSGSCVVDLNTQTAVGLHFSGKYLEANEAVLLPRMSADPMFKGVNFHAGN